MRAMSDRWDRWVARLVRAQLAMRGLAAQAEPAGEEDRWPARLLHLGAALMGASGLVLVTWVRRRL